MLGINIGQLHLETFSHPGFWSSFPQIVPMLMYIVNLRGKKCNQRFLSSWGLFLSPRTPIYTSDNTGVSQKTEIFLNHKRKTVLFSLTPGSGFQPLYRLRLSPKNVSFCLSPFHLSTRLKSEIRSK